MSDPKPLTPLAETSYLYDGSFAGFLCCVFESVYMREMPLAIDPLAQAQPALFPPKEIVTDQSKARRVRASIPTKISPRALELLEHVFLTCLPQKELQMLRFLLRGYRIGVQFTSMLGHQEVAPLLQAEKHLMRECHLLRGFVRFSDFDGVLAAEITPKNFVLPMLAHHFVNRFSEEIFIIYDKTHKTALVYQDRKKQLIPLTELPFPTPDQEEEGYRSLWKQFYKTIAIEARHNPRCRMTHMPKRYWENMTEMAEFL